LAHDRRSISVKTRSITLCICAVLVALLTSLPGCGRVAEKATAKGRSVVTAPIVPASNGGSATDNGTADLKSGEEREAAAEALRNAEDANAGSSFKVTDIAVADGWARVELEQIEVPREEAAGFGFYLRNIGAGRWEVVTSGTGVSPDDLPDAPREIFER
jgi:hypothetical protein